ncbi:pectin lyase-like protein [Lojkania enalia]|uniref:Pectin lyase-like protein n=1 Tax=Lojkania enalia TaxID=147567 RepID=A0A9P4JYJ0_9PLEO|nr:pectin lyase-like protein [Didymosphaeria enalia]
MKLILAALPTLLALSFGLRVSKREICTVSSHNDPSKDDVPAISAALKKCGDTGRVLLPANQTFHIRSPLSLSSCRACDFQINGLLKVSDDWHYWRQQPAAFIVPNTTAAIIRSEGNTGIIDANFFGLLNNYTTLPPAEQQRIPKLFNIEKESYQVLISNLVIKNTPGTAFFVSSNSTALRFYGLHFANEGAVGFEIENAKHVYLWNNTIRANHACVQVRTNVENFQVEESNCIITAAEKRSTSGIEFQLVVREFASYIRNIFARKVRIAGAANGVVFWTGQHKDEYHTVEVYNATFRDFELEETAQAVYLEQCEEGKYGDGWWRAALNVSEVLFRNWSGQVERESELTCTAEC